MILQRTGKEEIKTFIAEWFYFTSTVGSESCPSQAPPCIILWSRWMLVYRDHKVFGLEGCRVWAIITTVLRKLGASSTLSFALGI